MNKLGYDLDKIKFGVDSQTFEKAVGLYESGKVTQVKENFRSYSAIVQGTSPYRVSIDTGRLGYGDCTCYVGRHDTLCKHMVALTILMERLADLSRVWLLFSKNMRRMTTNV